MGKLFANNGDPDQAPHSAASDLGLHCLPVTLLDYSGLTAHWEVILLILFWPLSEKGSMLIGKNLLSLGNRPFSVGTWCVEKQTGSHKGYENGSKQPGPSWSKLMMLLVNVSLKL